MISALLGDFGWYYDWWECSQPIRPTTSISGLVLHVHFMPSDFYSTDSAFTLLHIGSGRFGPGVSPAGKFSADLLVFELKRPKNVLDFNYFWLA